MSIERQIRMFAGTFILVSLALSHVHSHYWLLFTAFVGFNLLQSSITNFCPLEIVLKKLQKQPCDSSKSSCCGGQ